MMDPHPLHSQHPPPPLPPQQPQNGFGPPPQQQQPQQPLRQQQKRKGGKRGKRGGLEARQRGFKRQPQQLGFFGQVPSLNDMRQENWRRTQQHYGGPPRPFPQHSLPQQHGTGRPTGNYRRARKAPKPPKQPKFPQATPRPVPLTPAAGNPLDTPANVGKAQATATGADKLEAEGLQAGLDWYGTNENTALFLTAQQLTTSDSEDDNEDGEDGSDGEAHSMDNSGGGAAGGGGGGEAVDDANLPRHAKARLLEQEAYIAELEDQNLRLREQLEMAQQEMEELRGHRAAVDSEEGFAEHSEGSLPGDCSVMHNPH